LFHGSADDWVAIGPCRAYVDRLKKSGVDATLTEYPGAQHGYDFFFLGTEPKVYPEGTTTRNCQLEEGEHGLIENSKTGKPYDVTHDPCVERGPHVSYSEATAATAKAVKEFLITCVLEPAPVLLNLCFFVLLNLCFFVGRDDFHATFAI
jgi:hypothetical protein